MTQGIASRRTFADIANAIRYQNGTSTLYAPNEMAEAVLALDGEKDDNELQLPLPDHEFGHVNDERFIEIADAIRAQNGLTREYLPREMAQAIRELEWNRTPEAYGLLMAPEEESGRALWFIRTDQILHVGDVYNGRIIEAVYEDVETTFYHRYKMAPWRSVGSTITEVAVLDEIAPISCMEWFFGFTSCTSFNLALLDTCNTTNFEQVFYNCKEVTSLDLSRWDTSNVTNFNFMFFLCSKLVDLDMTGWDLSSCKYVGNMFSGCSSLESLDISTWEIRNDIPTIDFWFASCSSLVTIYVSPGLDLSHVPDSPNTFRYSTKLVGGAGTRFKSDQFSGEYARVDTPETPGYFTEKELVTTS